MKQIHTAKLEIILLLISAAFCAVSAQTCDADFDLVLVVDSSGSIRDTNPENVTEDSPFDNYNLLKTFISRIVDRLEISASPRTGVQVGIITFGNRGRVELQLTGDDDTIRNKIDNLPYQGGHTNTSGGLWKAKSEVLANDQTNRPEVEDVILVITDGVATVDVDRTMPYATELQEEGVRMFAVGITEAAHEESVKELTSPNNDGERLEHEAYWLLPGFDALDEVVISIASIICDILSDLCIPQPCQNNGRCTSESNGFTCDCLDGYHGNLCHNDYCEANPCHNNGVCERRDGGYACNCVDGYVGSNCDINHCEPNPCLNGAQCTGDDNTYECNCLVGYDGTDCQIVIDYCTPNPCLNGACDREVGNYSCQCVGLYFGRQCEFLQTTEATSTTTNVVTAIPPISNQSTSQDDGISGYLIALIVIILLIVIGLILLILLCCFWSSITAYCRRKRERYVAPIKPLVIVEKHEEYRTHSTQCDFKETHTEPQKKTYEQQVAIVPACASCNKPNETCSCCPVCNRPDCDSHHVDAHHHHHHHVPDQHTCVPYHVNGQHTCAACHVNDYDAHGHDHMHHAGHIFQSSHSNIRCNLQGCAICGYYSGPTLTSIDNGSLRSGSHDRIPHAMLTYAEARPSALQRTRRKHRRQRSRHMALGGNTNYDLPNDTPSGSSEVNLVTHGHLERQGYSNPGYGSDSDHAHAPSKSRKPHRHRTSSYLNQSFASTKSRVSAGK